MKEERFAGKQNSAGEMGHRIAKHSYDKDQAYNNGLGQLVKSTYYVLDAQGNTMATYERSIDNGQTSLTFAQTEKIIYGSARLGVQNVNIGLLGSQNSAYTQTTVPHRIGKKGYELSNHLGNVLSVISDKAIPHNNGGGVVDYFLADIRQAQDYSPFGVLLQNRNLSLSGAIPYRYLFQGQEMDDEVKGDGNSYDFGARMLDPRLGRWFRIDPLAAKYSTFSPYVFVGNMPIIAIDPNGMEIIIKAKDGATIKYVPGMEVPKNITNQLQDVIMGLNHMYINVPSAQVKLDFLVNLENQGLIINIVSNFGAVNKFYPPNDNDPLHGEIFFNPNQADVLLNGGLQSPIVALAHELQHGYNYYDAYQAYDNAESEKDYEFADVKIAEYNNMEFEENRTTTTGLEPETAKTYNNSTREKYNAPASIYYVGCITCTSELVPPTEIAIIQIESTNKILEKENKEKVTILIQESQPTH
jgi:RHS repeat-associated protein